MTYKNKVQQASGVLIWDVTEKRLLVEILVRNIMSLSQLVARQCLSPKILGVVADTTCGMRMQQVRVEKRKSFIVERLIIGSGGGYQCSE